MIRLDSNIKKIQAVLAGAVSTNQLPILVCYSDKTPANTGGSIISTSDDTTLVDICTSPPQLDGPAIRDIETISVFNRDTASSTVIIYFVESSGSSIIMKATLAVGDHLEYSAEGGWKTTNSIGAIKTSLTGTGTGTVTDVSVISANGFAGSVADATVSPNITISTTVTGMVKGNGTAISAATPGVDYVSPTTLEEQFVLMTANQTTVVDGASDITDLVYPLEASSTYVVTAHLHVGCNNTGGVKIGIIIPSGSFWTSLHGVTTSDVLFQQQSLAATSTLQTTASNRFSGESAMVIMGTIETEVSAGDLQFLFASGVDTQTSTIYKSGTFLKVEKVL